MPDTFDRMITSLQGLPDVITTKATTIREIPVLVGESLTFIVQTFRQKDRGDTVFVEVVSGASVQRVVIPAKVADVIARQRDALTATSRSRSSRDAARARKAAGILPGFMRAGKRGAGRKRKE